MKISDKDIAYVINKIVADYQPEKIWLFGSYTKEEQTGSSDIDLLVIKQTETRPTKRPAEIQRIFNPYQYDLDILVFTPTEFEQQKNWINTIAYVVNKEGKLVYERPA